MIKSLIVAGARYQPFGTFPASSQTDDASSWDALSFPFSKNTQVSGVATDGSIVAIANQIGDLAITSDMSSFVHETVYPGLGIAGVGYNSTRWLAAGTMLQVLPYGPYPANSEVAQIHISYTNATAWEMVWSHPNSGSRLEQLKWFPAGPVSPAVNAVPPAGIWMAVGNDNNRGDAWYSLDNGFSWTRANIPSGVGRIFSVMLVTIGDQPTWFWGCHGKLFSSLYLADGQWSQLSIDADSTIVDMACDDESLVIVGQNKIYTSQDGIFLRPWSYPGYTFDRVGRVDQGVNSQWLVFARSHLTQYTHWLSTNLVNWEPGNMGIHVSAVAQNY